MSSYSDFLNVVNGLPSGTTFEITYDWCTAQGLTVSAGLVKSWGHSFKNHYNTYNCTLIGKGNDNHHLYKKN